jgi:hypothetical protein
MLMHAPAIVFCARQVANFNGDARLLLDLVRQAFDSIGLLQPQSANTYKLVCRAAYLLNLSQPPPAVPVADDAESVVFDQTVTPSSLVNMPDILRVVSTKFVPSKLKVMQGLPLQHQLVLCCAVLTAASSKGSGTLNTEALQGGCLMLAKSMALPQVKGDSFLTSFESLENHGLLSIEKVVQNKKFFSVKVNYDDISLALRNVAAFDTLFQKTDAKMANKRD